MRETKIASVDGDRFEYFLSGENGPSLVFLNGFRIPLSSWGRLYPELQTLGRVFTYNRLGVGKSSKGRVPQTGTVVVDSLKALLEQLHVPPPYVLVAHSLGGIFSILFGQQYPELVSSIVFVDCPHPEEVEVQKQFKLPFLLQKINNWMRFVERLFDSYKFSEDECIKETVQQIKTAGEFPAIPIAVVSGVKKIPFVPEASFKIHLQFQQRLLELSPNSQQFIAEKSDHFPQLTEPEVVFEAIREMVSTAKYIQ